MQRKLRVYLFIFLLTVLVVSVGTSSLRNKSSNTGAYLSDTGKSGARIGLAKFADVLSLKEGTSKARYYSKPGHKPLVATLEEGKLSLDFGEVQSGAMPHFSDVFRVTNLSAEPLQIEFKLSEEVNTLFDKVGLAKEGPVDSGQTEKVVFKLKLSKDVEKKTFEGKLSIIIANTSIKTDTPLKITVL